jgi:hypothetical protein
MSKDWKALGTASPVAAKEPPPSPKTAPSKIDMLPDDDTGPLYGIYEIKDGVLRCSKGKRQLEERVKELEGAMKFVKEK